MMHASIWRLDGDPRELARGYDAMLEAIGVTRIEHHLCLSVPGGLVFVDTCPSEDAFRGFFSSAAWTEMLASCGLPQPVLLADGPVHVAIADGTLVTGVSALASS
jgi:hypothetical protein